MNLTPVMPADELRPGLRATIEIRRDRVLQRFDAGQLPLLRAAPLGPVRTSKSWRDRPNYAGYYWAATTKCLLWFESLYEKAALMALDRDPSVVGLATQPLMIVWPEPRQRHFPDILAERADDGLTLIDVRPRPRIRAADTQVFARTAALCERYGVDYRLFADLDSVEDWNLRFLGGYRFERWSCPECIAERLRAREGEVRSLQEWLPLFDGTPTPSRGLLYAAVWHGALEVDLSRRLEMDATAICAGRVWG